MELPDNGALPNRLPQNAWIPSWNSPGLFKITAEKQLFAKDIFAKLTVLGEWHKEADSWLSTKIAPWSLYLVWSFYRLWTVGWSVSMAMGFDPWKGTLRFGEYSNSTSNIWGFSGGWATSLTWHVAQLHAMLRNETRGPRRSGYQQMTCLLYAGEVHDFYRILPKFHVDTPLILDPCTICLYHAI